MTGPEVAARGPVTVELDEMRREILRLTAENDALRARDSGRRSSPTRRARAMSSVVLIVVASLLVPVGVVGGWIRGQLIDTDRYVETVAPLVRDDSIRNAAAERVTSALVEGIDLEMRVNEVLPEDAGFLSSSIASGIENLIRDVVGRVVASEQFAELWDEANRLAHEQVVSVLLDGADRAGVVEIDLSAVASEASRRLEERGITFLADAGERPLTFTLVESGGIARLQGAFAMVDSVARVLPWVVIAMYAAAVYLAPDRRRGVVRAGVGVMVGSLGLLLTLTAARGMYLGALPTGASRTANEAVFDTLTRFLRGGGRTVLAIGVVMVGAAVAAGPGRGASWLRRTTSRWLDRAGHEAGKHGRPLGRVGAVVSGNARTLRFAAVMLGALALLSAGRPSGGTVLWIAVATVVALLVVDLLARTALPVDDATVDDATLEADSTEPTLRS